VDPPVCRARDEGGGSAARHRGGETRPPAPPAPAPAPAPQCRRSRSTRSAVRLRQGVLSLKESGIDSHGGKPRKANAEVGSHRHTTVFGSDAYNQSSRSGAPMRAQLLVSKGVDSQDRDHRLGREAAGGGSAIRRTAELIAASSPTAAWKCSQGERRSNHAARLNRKPRLARASCLQALNTARAACRYSSTARPGASPAGAGSGGRRGMIARITR